MFGMENEASEIADTSVGLEEADDLIDIHFAIVNDEADNLASLSDHASNLDGRFLDDLDPQHLNMTPLALAAALNKPHLCKVLLEKGASVDATFANLKTTALMTSSFHGHPEVVRLLLSAGANPGLTDVQRSTALGYCFGGSRQRDVVKQLLEAGVDVNISNVLGMNAFLLVSGYGNPNLLNMVLQAGTKVQGVVNNYGHTPLHLAVLGKLSQVNQITQKGLYNTAHYGLNRRNLKQTFLEWAKNNLNVLGQVEIGVKFEKVGQLMEDLGEHLGKCRLSSAEFLSDEEQLKKKVDAATALRKKILMESSSNRKSTILDSILSCGGKRGKQEKPGAPMERLESEPLNLPEDQEGQVERICKQFLTSIDMMLQVNCDMDKVEHTFALTPLDIAILNGDVESSALLLSRGADPDHLMSSLALSDLYQSISALRPDKKYIKDLLDHDKCLNVNQSFSQAHIPTRHLSYFNRLLPSTVSNETKVQFNFLKIKLFSSERLNESENEDMIGDNGLTSMAVAAKCRDNSTTEVIKMLAKHGADINGVGVGGRTPLGEACRWGNVKMVEFLMTQGADMEQPNPAFKMATPLAIATISRQPAIVQFLISKGAKIDKEMSDKRTPLISAIDCEDMAMVDRLLQADPVLNTHNKNSLDHQMIKLYQSSNKDIRVILQEISKRAAEIKAEEDEDEDAHHRSSRLPELRSSTVGNAVYETIQSEEVREGDMQEKAFKIKTNMSNKIEKVENEQGKEEVDEPLIVPQIRKALEPMNKEVEMPIYSKVRKPKKSSKKHVLTSKELAKDPKELEIKEEVDEVKHSNEKAFIEKNDNEDGPKKEDLTPADVSDEQKATQQHGEVLKIDDANIAQLLESPSPESLPIEPLKNKPKKIKKKTSEAAVEEVKEASKVDHVEEVERISENVTSQVTLTKKKSKKKVKAHKNDEENIAEAIEIQQELVAAVEPIVENNEIKGKHKTGKIKKSLKSNGEVLNEEVTV